jgi:muconate cycloisomerase
MPSAIRITDLAVFTVRMPVRAVHSHGIGDVGGSVTNVLLKVLTDAGIVGWGEAAPWAVFTGTAEANAAALNIYLRPLMVGADPFRISTLMQRADATVVHCTEAKAAVEMALFDIVGQALGVPVCMLLGGRFREEIPLSFSLANPDFAEDLELAQQLLGEGIRLFKLKTGFLDHASDLRKLQKLREVLPAEVEVRVDYNQGMEPYDAIRRLRDVEQFHPGFIEQPVAADKLAALGAITAAIDTPIMADESVFSPADALAVAGQHLADLISVKIMKSGGMMRGREVAAIAAVGGLACYAGSMFETGIAATAGAHLVAATPNISLGCEFYQPRYYLAEDVLIDPFPVRNGRVIVPGGPGLGVRVNEDAVHRYAV